MAFALEEVHPVKPEGFDLDEGFGVFGDGFGGRGVDEEGGCGAFAVVGVWRGWVREEEGGFRGRGVNIPTARIVSGIVDGLERVYVCLIQERLC